MRPSVKTFAAAALIGALSVATFGRSALPAEQRYSMQACGGDKPCVFVLNTETGEVRYCDTAGCRVLGAAEVAEKPSPFPFGNQAPDTGSRDAAEPFPLGEMGAPEDNLVDLMNRPPTAGGPSPFPYVEPTPGAQ